MNHYTVVLKLKAAQADLRAIGITLRKVDGEYQVYPKGDTLWLYGTNDIEDAFNTGRAMADNLAKTRENAIAAQRA